MNKWNLKLKGQLLSTLAPLKIKRLDRNLTKYAQDVYQENQKTLMNETKEELNK